MKRNPQHDVMLRAVAASITDRWREVRAARALWWVKRRRGQYPTIEPTPFPTIMFLTLNKAKPDFWVAFFWGESKAGGRSAIFPPITK